MKKRQKDELRAKELKELRVEALKREEEMMRLRMEIGLGRVKDTTSLRRKRDEIATMKTIIKEKEIENENI